ncbi:MAG: hypothetical protein HKO56_05770, partial [Bacteroidia bacterium]|nr:hypothetical protein [Bacteroidia bacterium]
MKKIKTLFAIPAIVTLALVQTNAQTPCSPATAQVDLDINNVRATIVNGGDLWWDPVNQIPGYEIPKDSGKHSIFNGALWIGGVGGTGQLHVASQTYRQTGDDYWPGPLDHSGATIDSTTCIQYDKIWKLNKQDVI